MDGAGTRQRGAEGLGDLVTLARREEGTDDQAPAVGTECELAIDPGAFVQFDAQPVGLERPGADGAARAGSPDDEIGVAHADGLDHAARTVAEPEGDVEQDHVKPEEAHHRPRAGKKEGKAGAKAHAGDQSHQQPEPGRLERAVGVEDEIERRGIGAVVGQIVHIAARPIIHAP